MIFGNGRPVFSGIAIGKAYVYKKQLATLPVSCGDPAVEQQKFEAAKQTALEQLQTDAGCRRASGRRTGNDSGCTDDDAR